MRTLVDQELSELARELKPVTDRFEGKTFLINGAGGFLGNYFVGLLQYLNRTQFHKHPIHIIGLGNLITGAKESHFCGCEGLHSDTFKSYNSLKRLGKYLTVNHSKSMVDKKTKNHINGIEGFWSFAKHILYNYRGVSKYHFPMYLKRSGVPIQSSR